jgi:hypothetical protein
LEELLLGGLEELLLAATTLTMPQFTPLMLLIRWPSQVTEAKDTVRLVPAVLKEPPAPLPCQFVPVNVGLPLFIALPQPTVGVIVWFMFTFPLTPVQVGLFTLILLVQFVVPLTSVPPHFTPDTVIV